MDERHFRFCPSSQCHRLTTRWRPAIYFTCVFPGLAAGFQASTRLSPSRPLRLPGTPRPFLIPVPPAVAS